MKIDLETLMKWVFKEIFPDCNYKSCNLDFISTWGEVQDIRKNKYRI